MSAAEAVHFEGVTKSFKERQILIEVTLSVAEGEALCILGRSGTGKSVTLKLMIGLLKPDSGQIRIQDEDIVALPEKNLAHVRRGMGFLFQNAALFDSFSVGDNLALPLRRFEDAKSPAEIQQAVADALRDVGLENEQNKMPSELSGGMQKRAGLARALILHPKLLLVDEPSSGLDRITAGEIDDLLLKVKTERHTTLVIVTHDLHCAGKVADKVIVLDKGRVAGFGTLAELRQSDIEIVRRLTSEVEA